MIKKFLKEGHSPVYKKSTKAPTLHDFRKFWSEENVRTNLIYAELARVGYHTRKDKSPVPVEEFAHDIGWDYTQVVRYLNRGKKDLKEGERNDYVRELDVPRCIAIAHYFDWPLVKVLRIAGYEVSNKIARYPE